MLPYWGQYGNVLPYWATLLLYRRGNMVTCYHIGNITSTGNVYILRKVTILESYHIDFQYGNLSSTVNGEIEIAKFICQTQDNGKSETALIFQCHL